MHNTLNANESCYRLSERVQAGSVFNLIYNCRTALTVPHFHYHDFAEITWVQTGAVKHLQPPHAPKNCPAGTLLLVLPEHVHAVMPVQDGTLIRNVEFPIESLNALAQRHGDESLSFWAVQDRVTIIPLDEQRHDDMTDQYDDLESRPSNFFFLERFLINALTLMERSPEPASFQQIPNWLRKAVERLQEPHSFDRGVSVFFEACYCSRNHATRWCKRYYGKPPGELAKQARLRYAASLLRGTDLKLIDIAFQSGYQDMAQFHREFKAFYQSTPAAFRLT